MTTGTFTAEDVRRWDQQFRDRRPAAIASTRPEDVPQVESLRVAGMTTGAMLRLALADGTVMEVAMNPVVAQYLLQGVAEAGKRGLWLDEDRAIILPPPRPLDS